MRTPLTSIRLPPASKAQLDYLAESDGVSAAAVVCRLLAAACRRRPGAPPPGAPARPGAPPRALENATG